jgi:hypothetical protein
MTDRRTDKERAALPLEGEATLATLPHACRADGDEPHGTYGVGVRPASDRTSLI